MRIKYESNLPFQRRAVDSVIKLFEGQPKGGDFFGAGSNNSIGFSNELGVRNQLLLGDEAILVNLQRVQQDNDLPVSHKLNAMDFSIEMATGTGKTYVYLRTIFELNHLYGFRKFIVAVPTIALREWVVASLNDMREHFKLLYHNVPFDAWAFDSQQATKLEYFGHTNTLQILVLNFGSFNKFSNNKIYQNRDELSGLRPIDFLRESSPIVILDESQSVEGEQGEKAIANLNPIFTLRYSASPNKFYNLVYKFGQSRANDLNVVKRIEVKSIIEDAKINQPFIQVQGINSSQSQVLVKLIIDVNSKKGLQRKLVKITKEGVDLFLLSGGRKNYQSYIINEINPNEGFVSFANGVLLYVGQTFGGQTNDVIQSQIKETIRVHLDQELRVKQLLPTIVGPTIKLKVLSLFLIDSVHKYTSEDGQVRFWFEQAYQELSKMSMYKALDLPSVEKVHVGYFATYKDIPKDTRGDTAADEEIYKIIAKDKYDLISPGQPLRFIFSHTALREGWDNPNIFQICNLYDNQSGLNKKLDTLPFLGLPIMSNGDRCFDESINLITIITNEPYEEFVNQFKNEAGNDWKLRSSKQSTHKNEDGLLKLKPNWSSDIYFQEMWNRIKYRTKYSIDFDSIELIKRASQKFSDSFLSNGLEEHKVGVQKIKVGPNHRFERKVFSQHNLSGFPDILGYLEGKTNLTRKTLAEILIQSGRLDELNYNSQAFMDYACQYICGELNSMILESVKYELVSGAEYEVNLFKEREVVNLPESWVEVENSIYDVVEVYSEVERKFAEDLDSRDDIKLFFKLPKWYKIDTPFGVYNPDFAIVKEERGKKEFVVLETKGNNGIISLRDNEKAKYKCVKLHFEALGVSFKVVFNSSEI